MKVIGTGLSGLVGSRIVELLKHSYSFLNLSKETGVDITQPGVIDDVMNGNDAPWVFHFAAYTDVDGAEKERDDQHGVAWKINVAATAELAVACQKHNKHLLYISTDYVFDGQQQSYSETDEPNPTGWYGKTKYEGELRVASIGPLGLIVRIANPYRTGGGGKPDFVAKIRERLAAGQPVVAPTDQRIVPTFIDDIASAIDVLVKQNATGIYHVVGDTVVSPFEAAQMIAQEFGYPLALIGETTFAEYFSGRAPRPFQAALKHDRITKLGVSMHGFSAGLDILKSQMEGMGI